MSGLLRIGMAATGLVMMATCSLIAYDIVATTGLITTTATYAAASAFIGFFITVTAAFQR